MLGSRLARHCAGLGWRVTVQCRTHDAPDAAVDAVSCDLLARGSADRLLTDLRPDLVINCVAITNVDQCEADPACAQRLNADLCGEVADAARRLGIKPVMISTDQLWRAAQPFIPETLPVDPLGVYGRTKAAGEVAAAGNPDSLVLRTNFFGPGLDWRKSLSDLVLEKLRAGQRWSGFADVFYTPIAIRPLIDLILAAVERGLTGTYHLCGRDRISKYEFSLRLAQAAGLDASLIARASLADAKLAAPRPFEMSLDGRKIESALGLSLPGLDQSIASVLAV